MILDIEDEHVVIVSDLHLGSPASSAATTFPRFLDHVEELGATLIVNGDGFDLLQGTMATLIADSLTVVRKLRDLHAGGRRIHYTIGNHDIAFEHLLADLPITTSPFLNLRSGDARIRVEHGHLYEPFYASHPRLYELGGRLARPLLHLSGDVYAVWASAQRRVDDRRRRAEAYPHHDAAQALFERGFDAVVFGHTHHAELTELDGGTFVNAGSWMTEGTWIEIESGSISLHHWGDRGTAGGGRGGRTGRTAAGRDR